MKTNRAVLYVAIVVSLTGVLSSLAWSQGESATSATPVSDAAVERTRQQVSMLDDLYKAAFALITTHYVSDKSTLPAGSAAVTLFDAMRQKGWHEVRLIDATGKPLFERNSPQDDFERFAIEQLLSGEDYVDRVVERDGKHYLRAATPMPVMLEKCAACHPHYADVKPGEPIGSMSYTVPIE